MSLDDHRRAAADRTLGLRARRDLNSVEVSFGGQASYVVNDPVSGESHHLSAEERRLFVALGGPVSLRTLQKILSTEFAPRQATIAQLQQFVNQLYDQGLLVSDAPGQGAELYARGVDRRRRRRWASLLQVLSIRLGGFNAGPLVDRLYAAMRWAFTPWALGLALVIVAYAAILAVANAQAIAARAPSLGELFEWRRLPAWLAAIACVKVLHELGHALACRHFGARPQEMGVLLLAGAPALYCDVSDAWRLPSKWRRIAVSGAGMFVELLIAAVAVIVWAHAPPGWLSTMCLSLIVVCTIGTVIINANPLLRYDGYYMLADWLEVPNLAERARGVASSAWRRWLLDEPPQGDPFVSPGKRRALWVYAIGSKVYLAAVLIGVFVFAVTIAKPHGLENTVYTLAAVTLCGLLVGPAVRFARFVLNPTIQARLRWSRVAATIALAAAASSVIWWFPMSRRIEAPLVAVPAQAQPVFAVVGGELLDAAATGAWLEAGDPVARLRNPELELALARQQGVVRERRVHLDQLRTLQAGHPAAARMIPAASAELADAEAQLAEQQAMVAALVIKAPRAGRVLGPPPRASIRPTGGTLAPWHGSPLDVRNRGAWIDPGTALAVIAPPGEWTAWAGVDQEDAPAVEAGQTARVLLDEQPMTTYAGQVTQVSRRARDNRAARPIGESTMTGGENPTGADPWTESRYHVVEFVLDAPPQALWAGARGTVKITAAESTLGRLAWMQLKRALARVF